MYLRKAARICVKRKTLALTTLILALTAATAVAATVTGDGTLVGSTGNDTIKAGNGNDTIWGLGGTDTISAGQGNDMIDANGICPPGLKPGDYPKGLPNGQYCSHGHVPGSKDTILAGNGTDTVYGGGGPNTISVGVGEDTIYGGPKGDTISAGIPSGNETIHLDVRQAVDHVTYTGSTVATGSGNSVIFAQNGVKDTISCAKGNGTTVYADRIDSVKGCAHVLFTAPSADRATKHSKAAAAR